MQLTRILIANEPRLLREMLSHTIRSFPEFKVVGEIQGLAGLVVAIRKAAPQWVIISLTPGGQLPKIVASLLAENPFLGIVALATDGGQGVICWMGQQEVLENISFNKLAWVLRRQLSAGSLLHKNGKLGLY